MDKKPTFQSQLHDLIRDKYHGMGFCEINIKAVTTENGAKITVNAIAEHEFIYSTENKEVT
jgi:hypothetical protein